jgi:hypothetical protein
MTRIAVVGDLSLQDPARLDQAIGATPANTDFIVQVGDAHPGYWVLKKYANHPLLAVPGNHDTDWDAQLPGWPRQWHRELPDCSLVGMDNHADSFAKADLDMLAAALSLTKPIILFVHKPLSTIVLPDGSTSQHIMGEGGMQPNLDAIQLRTMIEKRNVLCVHGHYHGWSFMRTDYADVLIEGRGGAAPAIGYTLITITKDGWVLHQVTL